MTHIVCDTMIWYYLGQGKLPTPDKEKYRLVCTYLTLTELAFSLNNFKKLEEVQSAISQILKLKPRFTLLPPFNYAKTLIDKDYDPEFSVEDDVPLAFLRIILNQPKHKPFTNETEQYLLYFAQRRKENYEDWAKYLNELYDPVKKLSNILKRCRSDELDKSLSRGWFLLMLNSLHDTTYTADMIEWSNFEFYETLHQHYHRNLLISKMKADKNDDNDLQNMIYVQPNDLYWTTEKRWLNITRESKIEKYLYNG